MNGESSHPVHEWSATIRLAQLRGQNAPMNALAPLLCHLELDRPPLIPWGGSRGAEATAERLNRHGITCTGLNLHAVQQADLRALLALLELARQLTWNRPSRLDLTHFKTPGLRNISLMHILGPWHPALQAAELIYAPMRGRLPWHAGTWPQQRAWWPLVREATQAATNAAAGTGGPLTPHPELLGSPQLLTSEPASMSAPLDHWAQTHLLAMLDRPVKQIDGQDLQWMPVPVLPDVPKSNLEETMILSAVRASLALAGTQLIRHRVQPELGRQLREWAGAQLTYDLKTRSLSPEFTRQQRLSFGQVLAWNWECGLHPSQMLRRLIMHAPQHRSMLEEAARIFQPEWQQLGMSSNAERGDPDSLI